MASSKLPTRLIYCVDGTYFTPDGSDGRGHGNITNVYRIYASVKTGKCFDKITQKQYIQDKEYEQGIGSADDIKWYGKTKAGVLGSGFENSIQKVYERCSKLDANDEVWLYGFSRGAYIVRAVAGLLHWIWALQSAGSEDFQAEFSKALRFYVDNKEKRSKYGPGQFHSFLSSKVKRAAQIQFVGVFDTVKALWDENNPDISFNDSIQHFRHALALNEDRRVMEPEYVFPNYSTPTTEFSKRSFIQAWFVGAHLDMGGSAKQDGLALYPLQWILDESRSKGLVLEFSQLDHKWAKIDDPLRVVFPGGESDGKGPDKWWTFETENGVMVRMQDLQKVHECDTYKGRYSIKVNKRREIYWPRQAREPFSDDTGVIKGYYPSAPQGTIIHPSVYQFLDQSATVIWGPRNLRDREKLEKCRSKMMGKIDSILNRGFWNDRAATLQVDEPRIDDPPKIRVLVCGNTGVGKSTLINRMFGVTPSNEVTKSSDRKRGLHDIRQELVHESRPGLIVHDSRGFEAGDESQIHEVEEFVREKSSRTRIEDRLHIIWFCIEMSNVRTQQGATQTLFKAISKSIAEVPIIVVVTKTDQFRGIQREEAREIYEPTTDNRDELDRKCEEYVTEQVQQRLDLIESEMREVEGGYFDACVNVARNDKDSLKRLNDVTVENVQNENLRLVYVATQSADIDLKINSAINETMKIYRYALGTGIALGYIPTAASIHLNYYAISVCKAIVQCFGWPTVSYRRVYETVKGNLWDDLDHDFSVITPNSLSAVYLTSTEVVGAALTAGLANIPLVLVVTTRLILILASDLILTFVRAFTETAAFTSGGSGGSLPQLKDVEAAASYYHANSSKVHKEILGFVPRRKLTKTYRYHKIRLGLEEMIHRWQAEITKDLRTRTRTSSSRSGGPSRGKSFSSDHTLVEDQKAEIMEEDMNDALKATKLS